MKKWNWYWPLLLTSATIFIVLYSAQFFNSVFVSKEDVRNEEVINTVTKIKNDVKIGLTKKEIIALFGNNYVQVNDKGDLENGSEENWKYRLLTDENYRPSVPDHVIDNEGIRNGKVGVELFVGWKHERVYLYTIAYLQGAEGNFIFYRNINGVTQEEIIKAD